MNFEHINNLFIVLTQQCEQYNIEPSWFNLGIHEDSLEIYTAAEHDEFRYHGDMGSDCETEEDVKQFVKSVVKQNKYYKKKEDEQ